MDAPAPSLGVIGSANVDLVVATDVLPGAGETVLGGDLRRLVGGKGANQAVAASRLGAATSFIGCVGDDPDGDKAIASLVAESVNVDRVSRSARPTGTALIVTAADGDNLIVVSAGANNALDLEGVDLSPFDGLLVQMEVPLDVVEEALTRHTRVIVNASPAPSRAGPSLALSYAVIVNEHEVTRLPVGEIERCVVTRGVRGAQMVRRGDVVHDVPAPVVDVVDSVGAGDVFAAAFAVRVLCGDADIDALTFAVAAGSIATLGHGARGSVPTDHEVQEWLQRGW